MRAWGPTCSRQDAYHLSTYRKRGRWILCTGHFEDNETFIWQHMPYAYGPKTAVPAEDTARELLQAGWTGEVEKSGRLEHFHFVTRYEMLQRIYLLLVRKITTVSPTFILPWPE